MSEAIGMVFHVQELCDQIVYHLMPVLHKSSQADLKSVALVCPTLCIAAQSQIFCDIDLDPWKLLVRRSFGSIPSSEAVLTLVLTSGVSSGRRLSAVLAASPHLLRHIRHLSVPGRSEILEIVSNMRIPLLRKIKISFGDTPWPSDDGRRAQIKTLRLPPAVDLSAFSALTRLESDNIIDHEAILNSLKPDNRIERIVFHVPVYLFIGFALNVFTSTDAFIADFPLPVLQQVEVKIYGPSNEYFGFKSESVPGCFPKLAGRGVLVVTDCRYDPILLQWKLLRFVLLGNHAGSLAHVARDLAGDSFVTIVCVLQFQD
ncbi:hypothetical protein FB451DRAFT_1491251 [Mycena latifolia]|nr:hypothetical protein FB451DRAFT_1491251 [Mycena latifolia]